MPNVIPKARVVAKARARARARVNRKVKSNAIMCYSSDLFNDIFMNKKTLLHLHVYSEKKFSICRQIS